MKPSTPDPEPEHCHTKALLQHITTAARVVTHCLPRATVLSRCMQVARPAGSQALTGLQYTYLPYNLQ